MKVGPFLCHLCHIIVSTYSNKGVQKINYVVAKADKVFRVPRSGAQVILRYGHHDRTNDWPIGTETRQSFVLSTHKRVVCNIAGLKCTYLIDHT